MLLTPTETLISSHLWTLTLFPEMLLYSARPEIARALLPFCCQRQFFLTFPLWLPDQGRWLQGEGLNQEKSDDPKLSLLYQAYPWRVRSQLVRHCEWCFRKEEKFFLKHYCHWNGVTHLPQSRMGALPSQKHPGCKNVTRRCNDLLKVFQGALICLTDTLHLPLDGFPRRKGQKEVRCFTMLRGWHSSGRKRQDTNT